MNDARTPATPVTRRLVEHALAIDLAAAPGDVRGRALRCVRDAIAVMIAGAAEPVVAILAAEARESNGAGACSVIGHDLRLPAAQAALVNGAAAHALDFDDVNLAINGHPSAVLVPALLAEGEAEDRSGADFLTAFVAGYETACRAGALVEPGHYDRGFHATSTVGSFGAALACARLAGLDAERAAHALGIAGTRASGLKAMFGTDCKPYHAGLAAENGVVAARLARRGMVSRPDVLECRQGFAATQSPDFRPQAALEADRWFIRDNLFKYHAACYGTHSAIECVARLRAGHAIAPGEVERVRVRVERIADGICNIAAPRTGLEAKFSLRFTTALALAGGDTAALASYSEAMLADPMIAALMPRVSVDLVDGWPAMRTEVAIDLRTGRCLEGAFDCGEPESDLAAQDARLAAKFTALCEPVLGRARARELRDAIDRIESVRVRELVALCRAQDGR